MCSSDLDGLDRFKVLCLFDCDVLTESVAARILEFQKKGGVIVADERLAPAIKPDVVVPSCVRTGKAKEDQQALVDLAVKLQRGLGDRYRPAVTTCRRTAIPRLRRYGSTDYAFVVNDRRDYGTYVGQHGLVMEAGRPSLAAVTLRRPRGFVYDLIDGAAVAANTNAADTIDFLLLFGPGEGRVFMVTDRPIGAVKVDAPREAKCGATVKVRIEVVDPDDKPVDAVIPLRVDIRDPDGRVAERTGWYGAKDGVLDLQLDFAANDLPGDWEIRVRELASGRRAARFLPLVP